MNPALFLDDDLILRHAANLGEGKSKGQIAPPPLVVQPPLPMIEGGTGATTAGGGGPKVPQSGGIVEESSWVSRIIAEEFVGAGLFVADQDRLRHVEFGFAGAGEGWAPHEEVSWV